MKRYRNIIVTICVLHTLAHLTPCFGGLDGENVGASALKPLWRGKGSEEAAQLALQERRPELALAAFGMFLRREKAPTAPQAVQTIVDMGSRSGMRDRVAFMLAFNDAFERNQQAELIDALTTHRDGAAQELAAATLAMIYCHAYITPPGEYLSARNDLKGTRSATAQATKRRKKMNRKEIPIPNELFSSRQQATWQLAVVAAAFSGNPTYRHGVTEERHPRGTTAGAQLLYLARQDTKLPQEQVVALFREAMRGSTALSSRQHPPLFDPMLPGGALACMGLAELGDPTYLPLVIQALEDRAPKVRIDAIRAIRKIGPDDAALAVLSKTLLTAEWPLLVEICATLGAHPDKRVIPALIKRLDQENGRFQLDIVHALSCIAGAQEGRTAEEWKEWWRTNGAGFEVELGASQKYRETTRVQDVDVPSLGFFYGLPIFSDHLVYVVDTSLSMRGPRIDSLRENLVSSLQSLTPEDKRVMRNRQSRVYFNIVDFGGDVVTMQDSGLTDNIDDGIDRAQEMPMTIGTRSYDALERAIGLEGADSIYFLSDGAPLWGQLEKWDRIMAAMDLLMLYRPVAIWSVAFDPSGPDGKAMTLMSDENFGRYEAPPL